MRQECERNPAVHGIQELPQDGDALKAAGADAGAPEEFRSDRRRRLFARDGVRVVHDRAAGAQACHERNDEVVDERVAADAGEERPADRVNRPVRTEQRAEAALAPLEERFVLPIHAVDVAAGRWIGQHEPPAHHADLGRSEPAHEAPDRGRIRERVRVRQHDDVAGELAEGGIDHRRLPAPIRIIDQPDARVGVLANDGRGAVGAAVRRDDDLELLRRIVERQRVGQAIGDRRLFVIRRDEERHARKFVRIDRCRDDAPPAEAPCENPDRDRIHEVPVHDGCRAEPQREFADALRCHGQRASYPFSDASTLRASALPSKSDFNDSACSSDRRAFTGSPAPAYATPRW